MAATDQVTKRAVHLDVGRLRAETPGCANVVHFNHAGASLIPQPVLDVVIDHLQREAATGGYEAAHEAENRLEAVYDSIARLISAKPHEIAVVENATRAWDMAFYAIPFQPGDRILTSVAEYASNVLAFLQVAQRGVDVEVVPNDEYGQLSMTALATMLDHRVKLIAVSHMPTNGGLIQPAAAIGQLARAAGALYLLDACQTVGQLPVDVEEIDCDMLSATSRKYLRGPRGAGFLYVRESVIARLVPPFLDLHAARWVARDRYEIRPDARRFENWEANIAAKLGMGAAVDYALALGLDAIWDRVHRQAALLRYQLSHIPGVTVHDLGEHKGGIVTFTVADHPAPAVVAALRSQSINTNTSTIASTRYDMEDRDLAELVRASVHYITTDEECTRLAEAVSTLPK
ncbi:MAG: aminotransferase class V-fold PLP-dependent enzyme [Thermomicrobiales bacterium]